MSKDYQGLPIPQTPEQKKNFDKTYRNVFGTRVKIPPPGPEHEALVERLVAKLVARRFPATHLEYDHADRKRLGEHVRDVLDVLAEEEG